MILEIEEGTFILSSNNCDTEQCNAKSDFNFSNCDNTNDRDNIKDSTHLTEDVLSIDENPNTLVVSNNNEMSGKSMMCIINRIITHYIINILYAVFLHTLHDNIFTTFAT